MAKVRVNGVEYDLRMTLWAAEQIENEWGDLREALTKFRGSGNSGMIKKMFAILANAGRKKAKQPMDVTPEAIDDCSLGDLERISQAMRDALDEAMRVECTGGGLADDKPADAFLEEYQQKN